MYHFEQLKFHHSAIKSISLPRKAFTLNDILQNCAPTQIYSPKEHRHTQLKSLMEKHLDLSNPLLEFHLLEKQKHSNIFSPLFLKVVETWQQVDYMGFKTTCRTNSSQVHIDHKFQMIKVISFEEYL